MAYIYEHIRTQGHKPLHLEKHYARLKEQTEKYFSAQPALSEEELRKVIVEMLKAKRCSTSAMNYATVRCFDNNSIEVDADWMMYDRFSLRAIHPQLYLCQASGEIITDNTSAKEALVRFNNDSALLNDRGVAVWVSEQNEVIAIDGSPVIAVFDDEIRFSDKGKGVEFDLAYEALSATNNTVTKGAIVVDELHKAKELLFIDYRGVTAINQWLDDTLYMSLTAERIASLIAEKE